MNKTLDYCCNYRLLLVILLVGVMGINSRAQNLVPNYSFESYIVCPKKFNGPPPPPWYIPTNMNGEYCNACDTSIYASVPVNVTKGLSFQYARTGVAYIGLDYNNGYSRTYVQVKLLDSLKAGHCYYAEHYVNIPNPIRYACNNIGMLFTNKAVYVDTNATYFGVLPANPQILNYGNPVIIDTLNWVKVSGVIIAKGGEQYLTLGNFKDFANTTFVQFQPTGYAGAAYYIDDVSVYELDSFSLKADAGRDTTITKGDSIWIGSRLCGLTNVVWYDGANNVIDTGAPGFWVKPTSNTFYVIEQDVCGQYSRDTVYIAVVPLPVIIDNYKLIIDNGIQNTVENVWVTASEINVSHFNVQRSVDGLLFNTVGKVNAKGASKYSFIDNTNLNGTVYYRLEIVDKNGSISYSEIRTLSIINYQLSITPNPAKDFVTIAAKNLKDIHILDNTGRVVISKEGILTNTITIDISNLAKGLYFVKATDKSGGVSVGKMAVLK